MKGKALFDVLLVEVEEQQKEKMVNGLLIVGKIEERFIKGIVVKTGEGRTTNDGVLQKMIINVGDVVYFPAFLNKKIKLEDKEYFVINQENVVYVEERTNE